MRATSVYDSIGNIVASISLLATRPFMPRDRTQELVPVTKSTTKDNPVKLGYH